MMKQFMQRASALDEMSSARERENSSTKKRPKLNKTPMKRNDAIEEAGAEAETKSALRSQIDSILFFDKAFSAQTMSATTSLKNRNAKLTQEKLRRRKMVQNSNQFNTGNSRSSSSKISPRKASIIPTFNKKKFEKEQKVRDLKDLAKRLRKDKKAGRI